MIPSAFFSSERLAALAFAIAALVVICVGAPLDAPRAAVVAIPEGATVSSVAAELQAAGALHYPEMFSLLVRIDGGQVVAGSYGLEENENAFALAWRFSHGQSGLVPVKVTFPEGTSVREMAAILAHALGNSFDAEKFIALASPDEGYLFPDTYFFLPGATPESVITQMKTTFDTRIASATSAIAASGRSETDIITMASILEKEARQDDTRRIVAGILWKRISLGMPLQVDATFGYIFATSTFSPSVADLKVDSPYNTYLHTGLPPGPIDNPGLQSIIDAATPTQTPYLYYVTDHAGNIYYAKTLDQHIQNIRNAR
ncbi:MAG: endolytic transglycosylase MltG [Patescibacteria group bacterium]|nr:endolytic transglycosylase MltG [Patescibacteria group bacterium]